MSTSYNIPVKTVAEYFLSKVDSDAGDCISNLKMQKLVYYAQGFVLAITGKTLFVDDIVAWQHGPVVVRLYNSYKKFGASCIEPPEVFRLKKINDNQELTDILDDIYNVYGQFSAWKLRNMTHNERPWMETETSSIIDLGIMQEHFKTLLV